MSDELGEAVGAILGIGFAGYILIEMASELSSTGPVDFAMMGGLFIVAAVLATILLVVGIFGSLIR